VRSDSGVAELAARQGGVVSRSQLRALGLDRYAVRRRVASGALHDVFRVYAVGHPALTDLARLRGALLCVGSDALLGHRTAAGELGMCDQPGGVVDVVVAGRGSAHRPGIRIHRTRWLPEAHRTRRRGLALTSAARTLLDLAGAGTPDLEQLVAVALRRHLTSEAELRRIAEAPGRGGGAALLALLDGGGPAFTRSEAERRLLALVREAGLAPPRVNTLVAGLEVDFLWARERLIVEVDGWAFHAARGAVERDHLRDEVLGTAGYLVRRVTWRRLTESPTAVAATLARELALRSLALRTSA
jgi:very-short-patch-repair endonuclease